MKVLTVVGARPQFIKAAPVSLALRNLGIDETIAHTGQHYDYNMSEVFFSELGIPPPRLHLGVGSANHAEQTAAMLVGIAGAIEQTRPDAVLVYGDTNSTLAGALAGVKLGIPIVHVEAGVRSFNRAMPEETNRVLTDHVASLLLCPSSGAVGHLANEGITAGVHVVGDVMYDALLTFLPIARRASSVLETLQVDARSYDLATVHRAENTDEAPRLAGIMAALGEIEYPVIWPVHPRTRAVIERLDLPIPRNLRAIDPVGYLDMLQLERTARLVLTDSGGMQKESYWLGVPCVTLRDETEWRETVECGCNRVAGTRTADIVEAVRLTLESPPTRFGEPLYGTRGAAERCAVLIASG